MLSEPTAEPAVEGRVGYVLKMYPRFSETFIVTEILAREAAGEHLAIFSLRPPIDPRFHPELARVNAPVTYIDRPAKPSTLWLALRDAADSNPVLAGRIPRYFPDLLAADVDDSVQAVLLARAALEGGVTHLHAHFASMATTIARLASLLSGIPYSFTAHAKDLFHVSVDPEDIALKLRDAHHTVTVTEFNLDHLARMHPATVDRVHLVRNGLELQRFTSRPARPRTSDTEPLRIVAVGRLVEKKGFALLVEAAAHLRERAIPVAVTIVGDGELRTDLAAQITRLGLDASVHLAGALPQNEVGAVVADADVFVAPCIVGTDGNADGLPTVILEAMALGVPCIASDVTGIPEVVRNGETGLLVRSGSVDDLVQALAQVAELSFDAAALTGRARRCVEQEFDSTVQAARLRGLLSSTAASAGTPGTGTHLAAVDGMVA